MPKNVSGNPLTLDLLIRIDQFLTNLEKGNTVVKKLEDQVAKSATKMQQDFDHLADAVSRSDANRLASAQKTAKAIDRAWDQAIAEDKRRQKAKDAVDNATYKARLRYEEDLAKGRIDINGKSLDTMRSQMDKFMGYVKGFLVAYTAVWVGTQIKDFLSMKTLLEYTDELKKAASQTGIVTDKLAGIKLAAEQSESSFEAFTTGMKFFLVAMGKTDKEAVAIDADLRRIGLTFKGLQAKPVEEAFLDVSEAFKKSDNAALKMNIAVALFGKGAKDLIPLLNEGRTSIEEFIQKAEDMGIAFTPEKIQQIDDYGDSVALLGMAFKGIGWSISTIALPELKKFVEYLTNEALPNADIFWGQIFDRTSAQKLDLIVEESQLLAKLEKDKTNAVKMSNKEYEKTYVRLAEVRDHLNQIIALEEEMNRKPVKIAPDSKEIEGLVDTDKIMQQIAKDVKAAGEISENEAKQTISYRKELEGIVTTWEQYAEARRRATGFENIGQEMGAGFRQVGSEPAKSTNIKYLISMQFAGENTYKVLRELQQLETFVSTGVWIPIHIKISKKDEDVLKGINKGLTDFGDSMTAIGNIIGTALQDAIDQISMSLANWIVYGEKIKIQWKEILRNMLASFINIGMNVGVKAIFGFDKGGYVSRGPGSFPKIPQAAEGMITPSSWSPDGRLIIAHGDEAIANKNQMGDLIGYLAQKVLDSKPLPALSGGGGSQAIVYNINAYGDFHSKSEWVRIFRDNILPASREVNYGRR